MNAQEQLEALNRLCPCCGVDSQSVPLSIFCRRTDLAELGAGYVIFFEMLLNYAFILVGLSIICIIKVVDNFNSSWCQSDLSLTNKVGYAKLKLQPCHRDWISHHSVANYGILITDHADLLRMVIAMFVYWVIMAVCKQNINNLTEELDRLSDTPNDWTMMVSGLPKDESADHIKFNFQQYGTLGTMMCEVKKISIAYDLEKFSKLDQKAHDLKVDLKKLQMKCKREKQTSSLLTKINKKEAELKKAVDQHNSILQSIKDEPGKHGLGICFVTLATKQQADTVHKYWSSGFDLSLAKLVKKLTSFKHNKFYNTVRKGVKKQIPIYIKRATNPTDINWEHLNVSFANRAVKVAISALGSILLLGASYGVLYGLKIWQFNLKKDFALKQRTNSEIITFRAISIGISAVVFGNNFLLSKLMVFLTAFENHWTKTAYFQSLVIKIVVVASLYIVSSHQHLRSSHPHLRVDLRRQGNLGSR